MLPKTRDPVTRDMLAYCRLIIREALRHGGNTWQDYDRAFHRQAAIDNQLSQPPIISVEVSEPVPCRSSSWVCNDTLSANKSRISTNSPDWIRCTRRIPKREEYAGGVTEFL